MKGIAYREFAEGFQTGFEPEPYDTVSEWADEHRFLSSEASAEPGRWRTLRTPYLKEIMDCLSPNSLISRIVMMKGAQIGGTECGNNWLGYIVHRAPGPLLIVEPTLLVAKRVSKQRIAPMIASTPALRARVSEARSRDSGNTTFEKQFPGGLLIMTGANSSAGLRSMPIRYLFCDEVDEYPGDVEGQGDPVALAERRTSTFARRKVFLVSTPTIKDFSRIENEYLKTDQRRFFVPCPFCGHMDFIQWSAGGWRGGEGIHHHIVFEEHNLASVRLRCSGCKELIEERHKATMLPRGEWRPTSTGDPHVAGFHLSSLYSPLGWKSWAEVMSEFLGAKAEPMKLKTWVNTNLGETWEEQGDSVEPHILLARAKPFPAEVPGGVGALVGACDVQGDRLEASIFGYGFQEQSWLVAHTQLWGDPGKDDVWKELDAFMAGPWIHESGRVVPVLGYAVDSGGHHTEQVYRYCDARRGARFCRPFCIKGGSVAAMPLVSPPSRKNRFRVKVFILGVNTGKDTILSRLRIQSPGAGYINLPGWIDKEYCEQLTAERSVRKYVKGKGVVREWVKIRERNEAFDLAVYALAALHILGPALVKRLQAMAERLSEPLEPASAPPPAAPGPVEPASAPPARPPRIPRRGRWGIL
jgi:phage terminase large subunit GpA-like protein